MNLSERMKESLTNAANKGVLRKLLFQPQLIDFCSNDYLGLAFSKELKARVAQRYAAVQQSGATGSRLLSGHHELIDDLEAQLSAFHLSDSALLFNSGYDANLSLFSTLPRRGDLILYDELVHASIHDGIRMGKANAIAFKHNDSEDLHRLLLEHQSSAKLLFVAIESVYSMDGDEAAIQEILAVCEAFSANLIVDEAHATGILGPKGEGLVAGLGLQARVFARVHTFGKAMGGHGAVVLGNELLKDYLINFARPLIFSTALPLHSVIQVSEAYQLLDVFGAVWTKEIQAKVDFFVAAMQRFAAEYKTTSSKTPIQAVLVSGNEEAVALASRLQNSGFDIRPIRYPTVPRGQERIRICLHRFNSLEEIGALVKAIGNNHNTEPDY
jgi:8-amino-7-oxononanoate synthase